MRLIRASAFLVVLLVGCPASPSSTDAGQLDAMPTSVPGGWLLLQHGLARGTILRFHDASGHYSAAREDRCVQEVLSPECLGIRCAPEAPFTSPHAGTVSIMVSDGTDLELMPDALGSYPNDPAGWRSGSEILVSATGSEVPAFSATVTMPGEPPTFAAPPEMVRRSVGLSLPGGGGALSPRIRIAIPSGAPTSYPTWTVDCVFPPGAPLTLPPDVLTFLPNGTASVDFELADRVVLDAGGTRIDVIAANAGPTQQRHAIRLMD